MTTRILATALSVAACALSSFAADPITWRTDYNAARKEAQEKNLPLLVDVQTEQCMYCRKMEASTFLDPGFVALVNGNFIPLKIDGNKDRELTVALRVQMYPTLVLAGPDGKIHAFLQGFLTAEQCRDHLKRTALAVATPDWIQRDLEHAGKAVAAAEYTKAVGLLRAIVSDGKSPPGVDKAKQVLEEIEGMAAQAFAAAKAEGRSGDRSKATNAVVDVSKRFAGTKAAEQATTHLASLAGHRDAVAAAPGVSARDLLATARDEYRSNRFAECLDLCDRLTAAHPRTDEARDAVALADQIKGDPDRLLTVVERQNERTANLYLTLADAWTKKGQLAEASACLEKVVALSPGTSYAAAAKTRLANLPRKPSAVPAGFQR